MCLSLYPCNARKNSINLMTIGYDREVTMQTLGMPGQGGLLDY